MWKLYIPGNIKKNYGVFFPDCIPSKEELTRKKIIEDPSCDFCGAAVESMDRILVYCQLAREVWAQTVVGDESVVVHNIREWWNRINSGSGVCKQATAFVLWHISGARIGRLFS